MKAISYLWTLDLFIHMYMTSQTMYIWPGLAVSVIHLSTNWQVIPMTFTCLDNLDSTWPSSFIYQLFWTTLLCTIPWWRSLNLGLRGLKVWAWCHPFVLILNCIDLGSATRSHGTSSGHSCPPLIDALCYLYDLHRYLTVPPLQGNISILQALMHVCSAGHILDE